MIREVELAKILGLELVSFDEQEMEAKFNLNGYIFEVIFVDSTEEAWQQASKKVLKNLRTESIGEFLV